MTASSTGDNPTDRNYPKRDDLTKIRGIGPAKQQWLRESLNIWTLDDLARASVESLESRLKAEGRSVSRSEIQGWIAQAQEFTEVSSQAELEDEQECPTCSETTVVADVGDQENLASMPSPAASTEEWTSFTSFTVIFQSRTVDGQPEYRTIANHAETSTVKQWDGIEGDRLQHWMLDQLSQLNQINTTPPTPVEPQSIFVNAAVTLDIQEVQAIQPAHLEHPLLFNKFQQMVPGTLKHLNPFVLTVAFALLPGNGTDLFGQEIAYSIKAYARQRHTGDVIPLGDAKKSLRVGTHPYHTVALPNLTLEQPGMYRLQVVITLLNAFATPGYLEVPMLQVV